MNSYGVIFPSVVLGVGVTGSPNPVCFTADALDFPLPTFLVPSPVLDLLCISDASGCAETGNCGLPLETSVCGRVGWLFGLDSISAK